VLPADHSLFDLADDIATDSNGRRGLTEKWTRLSKEQLRERSAVERKLQDERP
jgi:hypothetical protein